MASEGRVTNPKTSQSLTYGELTRGEKLVRMVSIDDLLTPAGEWKIAEPPSCC